MSRIKAYSPPQRPVAKGSTDKLGHQLVACRFDEQLFEAIRTVAQASNVSFAEQVRRFCLAQLAIRAAKHEAS
jgi:hypothetical protein